MIQIISYEVEKSILIVGFKVEDYVVYSSIGYDETKSKNELLQKAYEQCKPSIDYEAERYLEGKSNSIVSNDEGEEFVPDIAKVKSLNLLVGKDYVQFEEGQESETIYLSTVAKDQYGEDIEADLTYLTNYADIEDNILTIPRVEEFTVVSVTVSSGDISNIVDISVFPYQEPMPAIPSELEVLDIRVTEIEQVVDTIIGGEIIE